MDNISTPTNYDVLIVNAHLLMFILRADSLWIDTRNYISKDLYLCHGVIVLMSSAVKMSFFGTELRDIVICFLLVNQ